MASIETLRRTGAFRAAVLAAALLYGAGAHAQAAPETGRHDTEAIGGILVNQTISSQGLEFYRLFAENWRDKPDADNYSLTIVERPSRRSGNQIAIVEGQRRLLTLALPYRVDRIRAVAEQAVETSFGNLISQLIPGPGADADLAADEL